MKTIYCIMDSGAIKTLFGGHQNDPQPEGYTEIDVIDESPSADIGDSIVNGTITPAPDIPIVPHSVDRLQARIELIVLKKWDLIQPVINAIEDIEIRAIAQAYFEDARTWARNDQFVLMIAPQIGMDGPALDAAFISAEKR